MGKKYFWLKLKDDFFNQKEIKMLRKIAGGDTYTVIYLKMLLLSLKNDGKIFFDGIADNFVEEIALDIDEEEDNVQITMNFLAQKQLIEFADDNNEFYLSNIASMIGSETDSARRKRKQRFKEQKINTIDESNRDNVTTKSQGGHIEIEKRRDREDIEQETETEEKKEAKENNAAAAPNPYQFYQENFGVLNPITTESIGYWVDDLSMELVIEALSRAAKDQKSYRYAEGIMKNWVKKGFKSIEDVESEDVAFNKQKNNNYKKPVREETMPKWTEPSEDDEEVDEDAEVDFKEQLERIRNGR